ncbi:MAG: Crp/Fnr family transcriptional regulator [Clostridia bacterium]|nr:Crp/Fnr family transcriptional regulator [Clostridia bacterium]
MNCFLFQGLTSDEVQKVLSCCGQPVMVSKSNDIYKVGQVGVLLSGNAVVCRAGDAGCEVTIRSISSGDVFGVAGVFGSWKEGKSKILAKTDCKVAYFSESTLKNIFADFPAVAYNYISFLSDRIRFLNARIDAFSAGSAVQKLYEYLLSQAVDGEVKLNFGLAELSRRLKMGRSSLYRSIETLEQSGLVTRNKNIFIVK